ncbi:MAG: DUF4272 domain-containing protein [Ruminococcus sp.]|nr:DUF4272 domain-containing protein [Ruminococcus sp.]
MTQTERKERSEKLLKEQGIAVNAYLPFIEDESEVAVKELEAVCRRAVAALLIIQADFELQNESNEDFDFVVGLIDKFGVRNDLNPKERRILDKTCSQQDIIDVVWEYEACWALFWALGFVEDISDSSDICDCEAAVGFVSQCEELEDFISRCKLRSKGEILDMLDLYYRYNWAVVEKRLRPETEIGELNGDVVVERRRGLEWLLSDEADWYDISLDT